MVKIALVDGHELFRRGLKTLLEMRPDIRVIIECRGGGEFIKGLESLRILPDVVIIDVVLPDMGGVQIVQTLIQKYPRIQSLMFSSLFHEDVVINAICSGASGFLHKNCESPELFLAVSQIMKNKRYVNNLAKSEYFDRPAIRNPKVSFRGKTQLTMQEVQFIKLSASNYTYIEIAKLMGKQPKTLENYRDNLFKKLNLKNRAALVNYGYIVGILHHYESF